MKSQEIAAVLQNGRWLYGVLAERDGITRTWTIETSQEDAQAVIDDERVPAEYQNPRVMRRWESEWMEIE
ncbi:hypothetical protein GCM10028801_31560 [Nocardioides maradonensis]